MSSQDESELARVVAREITGCGEVCSNEPSYDFCCAAVALVIERERAAARAQGRQALEEAAAIAHHEWVVADESVRLADNKGGRWFAEGGRETAMVTEKCIRALADKTGGSNG